ncbi:hypothetical protein J437_LFUL006883 [Ladona fulva]|uniref:Beta-glucuronidase n=1 Tax=Ladona fulva TaxID=123851 RepID=A0A8K0KFD7_LADFU|nr:hypothetical protein J437_LFUL006883 [Ladona fulva]
MLRQAIGGVTRSNFLTVVSEDLWWNIIDASTSFGPSTREALRRSRHLNFRGEKIRVAWKLGMASSVLRALGASLLLLTLFRSSSCDDLFGGMLYPRESESREIKSLDGVWKFRTAPVGEIDSGFEGKWVESGLSYVGGAGPLLDMPVPSSFNDITTNASLRDYYGWAWYEKSFFAPSSWSKGLRVFLRFGSAHYFTKVWVNGKAVMNHTGGHLPFEAEVTPFLSFGATGANILTVVINNTLTPHTIPQGSVQYKYDPDKYPPGYVVYSYTFDFFNYAGIHRPVLLYTTPRTYIEDITINTTITDGKAEVAFDIGVNLDDNSVQPPPDCEVSLIDGSTDGAFLDEEIALSRATGCAGILNVPNPKLWWPYTMHPEPGHLYTLKVRLITEECCGDVYRLPVGIRTIYWNETSFLINDKPVYLRGFGRHEDSHIRGKGLDLPLVTRDHSLLRWVGANSYRTSHYPYAEEIMDFADRMGFLIVDECPGVNLDNFDDELLERHKVVMSELVRRDKNRASVVMWSIANEPRSQKKAADAYFRAVVNHTKTLDPSRPITMATAQSWSVVEHVKTLDTSRPVTSAINKPFRTDKAAQHLDIIGVNRYNSWYSDTGHLEVIQQAVESEMTRWNEKFNKPIFMSEYGADAVSGLHTLPESVWTEDYQVTLMKNHFKAFDNLRAKGFFIGEMIWNFADFATAQGTTRVVGNKKGVFTRERQPKASARLLRERYLELAEKLDGFPSD